MSRPLVLDASAALEMVLGRSRAELVTEHAERAPLVIVPDIFAAEVANALWKYVRAGEVEIAEALELLELCLDLTELTLPSADLVSEALSEAVKTGHPVYDLLYAITARRHAALLCTLDQRLERLVVQMNIPIAEI